MADRLGGGCTFRLLNVLDDFNRNTLGFEVDFTLPTECVIPIVGKTTARIVFRPSSYLDWTIEWRGKPGTIRVENGPEYIIGKLLMWDGKTVNCRSAHPIQPAATKSQYRTSQPHHPA